MRRSMILVLAFVLGACACKGKKDAAGGSTGGGAAACKDVEAHVAELYRAEASGDNIDEQVADNTQMVMNDCAANPTKVAGCAKGAKNVADLEQRCLIPLDQEGSEGDHFGKGK